MTYANTTLALDQYIPLLSLTSNQVKQSNPCRLYRRQSSLTWCR